jgi:hypothetical protein
MRTTTRPSFVMETVEDRTLMSVAVMSQFPSICMPLSGSSAATSPSQQPSSTPGTGGVSARPSASRAPTAPTGVTAAAVGSSSVNINWSPVARSVDTIVVDYSTDGVNFATLAMLDGDRTRFRAEGLASGATYSFKLWAMNSKGTSPASDIVSVVLG